MQSFTSLSLSEPLQRALTEVEYREMTPIQAASLPAILEGRDVVAQAQTGSGKTAAFALRLISTLDTSLSKTQGLVLCPTRELADQVSREIRRLACFVPNVKVLTLCGGVPVRIHLNSLTHQPHIAVGTPGRILDLLRKDALPLQALKVLVLDEADRMLDMGFSDDISDIISRTPKQRQTLMFSATMPDPIRAFTRSFQIKPLDVTVQAKTHEVRIEQTFFDVEEGHKTEALVSLLLSYRPESAVIFCNTRDAVRTLASELADQGFSTLALHGELEQREREEMLVRFSNRSSNFLIATDVAARGLDIKELPMVINFDIATDADTHIHRIGRTGRAGSDGIAFTLSTTRELGRVNAVTASFSKTIKWAKLPNVKSTSGRSLYAEFITLAIDAGKQDKLRPGDVLGALTGDAGLPKEAVGKIDVFPTRTYVAITRDWGDKAAQRLRDGKIKGQKFRVRKLSR
jgi:ATP-dependent RNA helicase DbpA